MQPDCRRMKKFGLYSCTCQAGISMHFGPLTLQRSGSTPGSMNALAGCMGAAGGAAGAAGACAATAIVVVNNVPNSNPTDSLNGNTSRWSLLATKTRSHEAFLISFPS